MQRILATTARMVLVCLLWAAPTLTGLPAGEAEDDRSIVLGEGHIRLATPEHWVRKEPRTRIVDYEFAAPAVEGDSVDGRLTVMGAGGSVQANLQRWIGQFVQADGKPTQERAVVKKMPIDGQQVHFVDIAGTYLERLGPLAPAVKREHYRMLGAIIVTKQRGQYFLKLVGPRRTIAANEKPFQTMLDSLEVK